MPALLNMRLQCKSLFQSLFSGNPIYTELSMSQAFSSPHVGVKRSFSPSLSQEKSFRESQR